MQFSAAALALFATAFAAPTPATAYSKNVSLTVESSNKDIDGQGLTNLHFGAGINGVLLSSNHPVYQYNPSTKQVATIVPVNGGEEESPYALSEFAEDLTAGITGAPFALVEGDYLAINGSNSVFYACTELNYDPYGYLKSSPGHGVGIYASDAPSVCEPIKIRALVQ